MPDLDAHRIAVTALAVADERGVDGFSMRAVAGALGVTPMALYHHVEDKAALARLVVDLVMSERPLPAPTSASWQDDMRELAVWTRATTLAHPVVLYLRRQYQVWTPAMFAMAERWLDAWRRSGLRVEDAIVAANVTAMAIFGAVEQEVIARDQVPPDPDDPALARLADVRAALTAERDPSAEFELLVRGVVTGVHDALERK